MKKVLSGKLSEIIVRAVKRALEAKLFQKMYLEMDLR